MPQQNASFETIPSPPARVPDDSIDLSSGMVKKPVKKDEGNIDLSAGLVARKGKAGAAPTEEAKSNHQTLWSKTWTGLVSPETGTKVATLGLNNETLDNSQRYFKFRADQAKKDGHYLSYAYDELQGYVAGAGKAEGEIVSSLTSPGQIGLTAATMGGNVVEQAIANITTDVGEQVLGRVGVDVGEQILAKTMGSKALTSMLRIPGRVAAVYFGAKGLQMAFTPQQEGESKYDSFWRRSLGASAFVGTVYSEGSSLRKSLPQFIQHYFGLSDDLAGKISSQVDQLAKVRKQREGNITAIDAATRKEISGLRDNLRQQIGDIHRDTHSAVQTILTQTEEMIERNKTKFSDAQKQSLRAGARTVADTMQAFLQEKARAGAPFDQIANQIQGVVAEAPEIHDIVAQSFRDSGLDPQEIPPRAVSLLKMPEPGEEGAAGGVELRGPDGKTQFVNEKYAQGWMDRGYERVGKAIGKGGLDFERLTRIREDLGQAAESAKDSAHKRALFKARDDITNLQERIAGKKGQGEAYRKAKQGYTKFVRGIGSDMVHTFLDASDAEAQTMAPKIKQFMQNREIGDGLRGVLKAAGVDVEPLDKLVETQNAIEEATAAAERMKTTRIAEAEKSNRSKIGEARKTAAEEIGETKTYAKERKGEEKAALKEQIRKVKTAGIRGKKTAQQMFGKDVEELSGADRQHLEEMLIHEQMNKAAAGGFANWAYWTFAYGLLKLGMGSPFGIPGVVIGGSRLALPRLLMKPEVQDWVVRQSGIDPATPAGVRARRGLTHLQRVLRSGVPQTATANAAENSLGEIPKRQ